MGSKFNASLQEGLPNAGVVSIGTVRHGHAGGDLIHTRFTESSTYDDDALLQNHCHVSSASSPLVPSS